MNECAAPCSQEPIKKNSNILPKIILLTAVLLLLLAGVITKLLFAPWQEIAPVQLQPADFLVQHRVISKVMKEFYRKKGPRKEAVLKLSVPEANSILRIAGNIKYKKSPYPLRYYRPEFKENGELSLTFPLRTPVSWLWGGCIYVRLAAMCSKTPEQLECKLTSLHLTSLPLPLQQAQQKIDLDILKLKHNKNYRFFDQAVKSISFDGKRFVIVYRPRQMMMLITSGK